MDDTNNAAAGDDIKTPGHTKMQAVTSSQISEIGYDSEARVLSVRFNGKEGRRGNLYRYSDVTPQQYDAFLAAPSKGSWFGNNIKNNADHPYTRVAE